MANKYVDFKLNLQGLDAIEKRLQQLPEKLRRRHIRKGLQLGIALVADEARKLAPTRKRLVKDDFLFFLRGPDKSSGLKKAIASTVTVRLSGAEGKVGLDYSKVQHGHLVEFGTKPHKIGKFQHPGARKQPFMRPAYDSKGQAAVETMVDYLIEAVEKEV